MAKRRVNKSTSIREVLAENPSATPKEITATLKARRVRVSPALISQVKHGAGKLNGEANDVVLGHLIAAKVLVGRVGSIEAAKSAIASLAKLDEACLLVEADRQV
jgi:hypothetical protein